MTTADKLKIQYLESELEEAKKNRVNPLFTLNRFDEDGDLVDKGIFIHMHHTVIHIGEKLDDLDFFIEQLNKCRAQIKEREHELEFDYD